MTKEETFSIYIYESDDGVFVWSHFNYDNWDLHTKVRVPVTWSSYQINTYIRLLYGD